MTVNLRKLATAAFAAGALVVASGAMTAAQAGGAASPGHPGMQDHVQPPDCPPGTWRKGCPPPGGHQHHHHHHGNWNMNFWIGTSPWYYGPGPWYNDPVYPYASPYYDEDYHVYAGMTCNAAKGFLQSQGYRNVHAKDCSGRTYGFTATKKGHKYKITLNKYSGRYSRSRIY